MRYKLLLLIPLIINTRALGETIEVSLTFDIFDSCPDTQDCLPWGETLTTLQDELKPVIPVKLVRVLLPDGEAFDSIDFYPGETSTLNYSPEIVPQYRTISGSDIEREVHEAYEGGEFPLEWTGQPTLLKFRGYQTIQFAVFPLRVQGDGTARYITEATIHVNTKPALFRSSEDLYRGEARDYNEALWLIDNEMPRMLGATKAEGYLIIGPTDLVGGPPEQNPITPLVLEKRGRGLEVEIATLENISSSKEPNEIREYIKDRYQEGIDYVLLVGDHEKLPWKKIRTGGGDWIPSDQYYACLDDDFSNPSEYDWACEVAVGRVGVRTKAQLSAWVFKTLAMQEAAKQKRTQTALHYGEKLDSRTYGGWALDRLIDPVDSSPASVGFPASVSVTKLHDDRNQSYSATDFIEEINSGDYHFVNHDGHASSTYAFRMNASRKSEFKFRPSFFYSVGCHPNNPDTDNWTIQATRYPEYGPAAMIGNTRYGWYSPGSGGGTSNVIQRNFWSMRFGEGIKTLGRMNHRSKEVAKGVYSSTLMTYTALEVNLIGDPEFDLGTE